MPGLMLAKESVRESLVRSEMLSNCGGTLDPPLRASVAGNLWRAGPRHLSAALREEAATGHLYE